MKKFVALFLLAALTGAALAESSVWPVPTGQPQTLQAYVTGYSFWDNAPPGRIEISHRLRQDYAGGMGTYSNPVTLAVGHMKVAGQDRLDIPAGTLFYLPYLRKYAVVEDTCNDGQSQQPGPCHGGYEGNLWLEIYLGGDMSDQAQAARCREKITAVQPVVMDPLPDKSVVVGPVTEGGCYVFPNP